jgi:peroxiredoxin (alkyl hydroperoxide reductase subunit C)
MSVVAPGTPAPDFTLKTEEGEAFTRSDLLGQTTILVFYPFAFSPVCTDQLQVYEEVLGEITAQDGRIFAVSCDASYSQTAFRKSLNVTIPQLSDFEPKGAASRAFGAYFEPGGMSNRCIVVTDPEGVVRWSFEGETPAVLPGANLLFDGLSAVAAV